MLLVFRKRIVPPTYLLIQILRRHFIHCLVASSNCAVASSTCWSQWEPFSWPYTELEDSGMRLPHFPCKPTASDCSQQQCVPRFGGTPTPHNVVLSVCQRAFKDISKSKQQQKKRPYICSQHTLIKGEGNGSWNVLTKQMNPEGSERQWV